MNDSGLEHLNAEQKKAVLKTDGPLLVIAGAGSGKTRVITEKIKHLVQSLEVEPYNILAITFTNKAAGELKERLHKLEVAGAWVSTFHSMCVRILRKEAHHLGLDENFSIYDTEDQSSVVRACLKEMQLDPAEWPVNQLLSNISLFKSLGQTVETVEAAAEHYRDRHIARLYANYQRSLSTNQALDFDDLLTRTKQLFELHPLVLEKYQRRFHYVLVDEYQDTNSIQYWLVRELSRKSKGVTVTGDPNQSIYSWRGADIQNILNFEKDFSGAETCKLHRNYRSTKRILQLSNQIIRHNTQRFDLELETPNDEGTLPVLHCMLDTEEESRAIALSIAHRRASGENLSSIAVFYRTNAQSRSIEEALSSHQIPYTIVGGLRFFERMEVKDLVAYLRFTHNPSDGISLMRVINRPARGISETTKQQIRSYSEDIGCTCWQAMMAEGFLSGLATRARESVIQFNRLMANFFELSFSSPDVLLERIIDETRIVESYRDRKGGAEEERIENMQQFMSFVTEFCVRNPGTSLSTLLENVALLSDVADKKEALQNGQVILMTLHSAKGLEFPYVYFAGLDEGILPHERSLKDATQTAIEEERRLCYVGITRAMRELHLYTVRQRFQYNKLKVYRESRFVSEMMGPHLAVERGGVIREPEREKPAEPRLQAFAPAQGQRLRKGEAVRHARHGKGIVLHVEGGGASEKAKIFFDKLGEKILLVEFEALEPLR